MFKTDGAGSIDIPVQNCSMTLRLTLGLLAGSDSTWLGQPAGCMLCCVSEAADMQAGRDSTTV